MEGSVPALAFIASVLCGEKESETVLASQVCDSGKVSDHHAIVPTKTAATGINISDLPTGERNILLLVARSLLRAVCPPFRYAETVVTADCGGNSFTAKGKTVLDLGWRTYAENKADTVLPEMLQSPLLTAEWENRLKQVERGELSPEDFMEAIAAMVRELAATCSPVPGGEVLFPSGKESIGPCPRCQGNVIENKKSFFCENPSCRFALWKDNRFFAAKRKDLDKAAVSALLNEDKLHLTGCWSEKTRKTYDSTVYLEDDGEKTYYRLEFDSKANG